MADRKPRLPIRRFDVFADYNRVKHEAAGMPEARAKGDAIWLAKVVAGRRGGSASHTAPPEGEQTGERARKEAREEEGFRSAGGIPQTDRTFDKEIIDRMGEDFYREVVHPAIEQAVHAGKKYEDIRDTIRKEWK
ncbi:MAG TPA: hypothetical protein VHB98_11855 [Chloroflexota bacterium]|nr:hypothetical protein [Chloroflexota bacterium]